MSEGKPPRRVLKGLGVNIYVGDEGNYDVGKFREDALERSQRGETTVIHFHAYVKLCDLAEHEIVRGVGEKIPGPLDNWTPLGTTTGRIEEEVHLP